MKTEENDAFRTFLKNRDLEAIDGLVHNINKQVEKEIDCTQCGACCKHLMIHITEDEAEKAADSINLSSVNFKEQFVEISTEGQMIMNTIPCHFLEKKSCSIYENRFSECRDFPHLHKANFTKRLFSTLIHYSICPIIYNVVEELKIQTGFKNKQYES